MAARVVDHLMFDVRLERYGRTAIEQFALEAAVQLLELRRRLRLARAGDGLQPHRR